MAINCPLKEHITYRWFVTYYLIFVGLIFLPKEVTLFQQWHLKIARKNFKLDKIL